jgi:hypothetical protein
VATNNVPTTDADLANWQHMVTFGLALADGLMTWQSDYVTAQTGDYKNITPERPVAGGPVRVPATGPRRSPPLRQRWTTSGTLRSTVMASISTPGTPQV